MVMLMDVGMEAIILEEAEAIKIDFKLNSNL
jgi:hypothetical protein